jgi:diacylglycerol kinase (ATP)
MQVTLVYNPTAGEGPDERKLTELMEGAGHKVRAVSRKKDWLKALEKPADVVVAAGGDGTITKVAIALAGRGVPLAILPMGTGNNAGKALELMGDVRPMVQSWGRLEAEPFDLGSVSAPWDTTTFVESFGGGTIAGLIAARRDIDASAFLAGRVTDRSLHQLGERLASARVQPWAITIDGESHHGDYVAVEILNIRFVGPNLPLAPDATPGDGRFDVVLIGDRQRRLLTTYLRGLLTVGAAEVPELPVLRGRDFRLDAPAGVQLHVDDDPWPDAAALSAPATISVSVRSDALRVMPGP